MATVTQKYGALVMAPWLQKPQMQFATFTFDDATPAQLPTMATIREELARRSAFKDEDATTTNDTWGVAAGDMPKGLEVGKLDILALWQIEAGMGAWVKPYPNLRDEDDYVWPGFGSATDAFANLTTFTIAGDDYLTTNIADADDTPPVVCTAAAAKGIVPGDRLIVVNETSLVIALDVPFVADGVDGNVDIDAVDLASTTAGTYNLAAYILKQDGRLSRAMRRTLTNS